MPLSIKRVFPIKRIHVALALALCAAALRSGPVEFGSDELNAAIDSRNFKYKPKIMAELNLEPPETFRIDPYSYGGGHITGGDLRGLMYGLIEAAQQMRASGRLKLTHGIPALALRGIRIEARPDAAWFLSTDFWRGAFTEMAHDRFNRLEIAFDPAPSSQIMPTLRSITQIAQLYGVDIAIGFAAPAIAAIEETLSNCPLVKAIALHSESFPETSALLETLHSAGRRVVLELPDTESTASLIEAAGQAGAPLRLFAPYTGTAINPRPRDAYWQMDPSLGADAVNAISGAGFEVAAITGRDGRPALEPLAEWGHFGYTRPAPGASPLH